MPNWITNKIKAPHVIMAMLNADGNVDFNNAMPTPTPYGGEWGGIMCDAEMAAEIVLHVPVDTNPMLAALQSHNRAKCNIAALSDESFEQFIGMLRNHRACGYLHSMDFARKEWGTKWNACESVADPEAGTAEFDTAWACPKPIFHALSLRFPTDEIQIVFADEDIGSNCGTFTLKNGEVTSEDIAPSWHDMTEEQKQRWKTFAYDVKGREPDEDED